MSSETLLSREVEKFCMVLLWNYIFSVKKTLPLFGWGRGFRWLRASPGTKIPFF